MGEFLSVTPEELAAVGKRIEGISDNVRIIYEHVEATVNAVTSNDSWKSEASETLITSFESASKNFKTSLSKLELLGPALAQTGEGYKKQEDENVSTIKEDAEWQN